MSNFLIRIELKAPYSFARAYFPLHREMENAGFTRSFLVADVLGDENEMHRMASLPGEYVIEHAGDANGVLALAVQAATLATSEKRPFSILCTEAKAQASFNLF